MTAVIETTPRGQEVSAVSAHTAGSLGAAALHGNELPPQQPANASKEANEPLVTDDAVADYFRQIGRIPLLSAEQEVALAKKIEAGLLAEKILLLQDEEPDKRETIIDGWFSELEGKDIWLTAGARRLMQHLVRVNDTPESRNELAVVQRQGETAKSLLIQSNLKLVVSIAKGYYKSDLPFLDRIQEGNSGLIHAVEKFDYTKGFKFSTYASWWIREAITKANDDQGRVIRLPGRVQDEIRKMRRAEDELRDAPGVSPTPQMIAVSMNTDLTHLSELIAWEQHPLSLDLPVGPGGDSAFGDFIVGVDGIVPRAGSESQSSAKANALLAQLDERTARVLRTRYGLDTGIGCSLKETAQELGLSQVTIRKIERQGLATLRELAAGKA
jgi:RNA polymerase primary sigma factor